MTIQTEGLRAPFANTCGSFREAVRTETDRVVVFNPDWPPNGFTGSVTADIRSGIVGPVPARVASDDRTEVEVYYDGNDPMARGLNRHLDHHASTLRVEVANLLKVEVVSAIALRQDEIVAYGEDHTGLTGDFDLQVVLRATPNLYCLLPPAFIERYDPQRAEPNFTFKAHAQPLGDGVYELWLLLGGRGGSPEIELEEQYLLGRGDRGNAFAWPVYATYTGTLPTEPEIELGKVYNVRLGSPALVLSEVPTSPGRFNVARMDPVEQRPLYSTVPREDLLPLSDSQWSQRDDWLDAAIAIAVAERRTREATDDRLDGVRQQLQVAQAEIGNARRKHEADIEAIGDTLIEEAESRNWCSDYDEVIDNLNPNLHIALRERKKDFTVRTRVTYYVDVDVEARNAEAAEAMVDEDRSLVMDQLDTDNYDSVTVTQVEES